MTKIDGYWVIKANGKLLKIIFKLIFLHKNDTIVKIVKKKKVALQISYESIVFVKLKLEVSFLMILFAKIDFKVHLIGHGAMKSWEINMNWSLFFFF